MEGKLVSRKGLHDEKDETFVTRITLTEDEKTLFDLIAERLRPGRTRARLGNAGAASYLIRLALYCLGHHTPPTEIEARKIGKATMRYLKDNHAVRVVKANRINSPNIYTTLPDGSKVWDNDIEEG